MRISQKRTNSVCSESREPEKALKFFLNGTLIDKLIFCFRANDQIMSLGEAHVFFYMF